MIKALTDRYPTLTESTAGVSRCRRSIKALSVGEGEKSVFIAGAFHGQEWLTALIVLRLAERLVQAQKDGEALYGFDIAAELQRRRVILMPMVNPDGVEIALHGPPAAGLLSARVSAILRRSPAPWNANAAGVDINHNFNAGFAAEKELERAAGITSPSPGKYGGTVPESEPETIAVIRECQKYRPIRVAAVHSQGRELYYSYGGSQPPGSADLARLLADACGYELKGNSGLASHAGFKDWFISRYNLPGFTFEVGKGTNPLPVEDFESIYTEVEKAFIILLLL